LYRPLLTLRDAIGRFASREYSARVQETGTREIREIARSFNVMAATLERHRSSQLSFLAAIAHDLRNPLSVIRMALDTVPPHSAEDTSHSARITGLISRQIDVLLRIISDLLDTTLIEAGQLQIGRTTCDARELVMRPVELFRASRPPHDLVVRMPEHPVELDCDPLRIEQVMNNLVSNAIKYSPGGGRIEVSVRRERNEVALEVRDQGIGIAREEQDLVFEPFRRGSISNPTAPGVGLGLSVARRVVEAHGGRIDVESMPGRGSTFTIHLPRSERPTGLR
jgi:signal transduction histidine kinase